jgi:hypothetical protein
MEIFVVGIESDVIIIFGEFIGVTLDELDQMRVVVGFYTKWNDLVYG